MLIGADSRQQRALRLSGNIVQRGERSRCKERVTRSPQHTGGGLMIAKLLKQCSLADTRSAAHERNATTAIVSGTEPFRQIRKKFFALEKFHWIHQTKLV
jgi:hypothetical protein